MPAQPAKLKGGRKLRRHGKDAPYYAAQYSRTHKNKLRRLTKRNHARLAIGKEPLQDQIRVPFSARQ